MINENRSAYITNLPSPSFTQNKALEKLTLRRDRGRQQKEQRQKRTDRIFHDAHWILYQLHARLASWSENLFQNVFHFNRAFVILLQPIIRGVQFVVFFLGGYLLVWRQRNVLVTLSFKYSIHWGKLHYLNLIV